jgi:hypothetical protein
MSLSRRAVKLATPMRYIEDTSRMEAAQLPNLIDCYLSALDPKIGDKERFLDHIRRRIKSSAR